MTAATQKGDCLIVFAKPPVEGEVKTRLAPAVGQRAAADIYRCFLVDALAQYRRIDISTRLYFAEGELPADLLEIDEPWSVRRQNGSDLGQRMANAFLETFGEGFNRAVIIGTDHPSLPDQYIRLAFESLDETESVVIGPSEDGGYYLLGMRHYYAELFRDAKFSHESVFDEALERAACAGASLTVLPMWYDVDTPDALRRLLVDLRDTPDLAPATYSLLTRLPIWHDPSVEDPP